MLHEKCCNTVLQIGATSTPRLDVHILSYLIPRNASCSFALSLMPFPQSTQCAPTIVNHKCPVCRQDFVDTFDVPDPLEDPMRWFHVVDVDQVPAAERILISTYNSRAAALILVVQYSPQSGGGMSNPSVLIVPRRNLRPS